MEIYLGNYEYASEALLKPYIQKSNKFDTGESVENVDSKLINSRPWLRGNASRTFGGGNSEDTLPLKNT